MNLLIWGISGQTGKKISQIAKEDSYWTHIEGITINDSTDIITRVHDVVIDFSHPSAIEDVLIFCCSKNTPLVLGTTGFSKEQMKSIHDAAVNIPVLHSTNMSPGMNIVFSLVERVAKSLKDSVDIEVIEAHHNRKKDAPSGSAKTIVDCIEKGLGYSTKHQHGRKGQCLREKGEIGIHAIRGGSIVGMHEVSFINSLETIKVTHEAHDRTVFAQGALDAAKYLIGKPNGIYSMKDVLDLN
ncbi:MAG: 4-hydroxy-tetrahydrodipicolinate reductase [Clostridiales bacterium]|nr:4-hydroxy-tetrahydrodipicolinate reductase [Clostridiales bacterium]